MMFSATRSIASNAARRAVSRSSTVLKKEARLLTTLSGSASRGAPLALSGVAAATSLAAAIAIANNQEVSCDKLPVYGVPGTNQERTFLAVKPDGVQRGLIGDIIARFEKRGYKLVGLKMVWPTLEMAQNHYKDLAKKPFYPGMYYAYWSTLDGFKSLNISSFSPNSMSPNANKRPLQIL